MLTRHAGLPCQSDDGQGSRRRQTSTDQIHDAGINLETQCALFTWVQARVVKARVLKQKTVAYRSRNT